MCVEWWSDLDEVCQSDVKSHAADDRKVKLETGSRINLFLVHVTLIIQINGGHLFSETGSRLSRTKDIDHASVKERHVVVASHRKNRMQR